jgi:hypothetical protein
LHRKFIFAEPDFISATRHKNNWRRMRDECYFTAIQATRITYETDACSVSSSSSKLRARTPFGNFATSNAFTPHKSVHLNRLVANLTATIMRAMYTEQ